MADVNLTVRVNVNLEELRAEVEAMVADVIRQCADRLGAEVERAQIDQLDGANTRALMRGAVEELEKEAERHDQRD